MRPSVFVRTQYWYAEGVPAASNFHTSLLQTIWKCEAEKQPGWKLYLDASFSVSCRASRETQTQILRTTALFDGALAQNSLNIIWTPLWRRDFPLGNGEIMIVKLITRRCRNFKLFLPIFNSNFNPPVSYCIVTLFIITLLGVVARFCTISVGFRLFY